MRIAICFSGAIRDFKYCYPSIYKNLIEPLNPDIFVHAWSNDKIDKNLKIRYKMKKDSCTKEYVLDKLKPKKYFIEDYNRNWEKKIIKESGLIEEEIAESIPDKYKSSSDKDIYRKYAYNALGMYYKIWQCNLLKCEYESEHNFTYDIVIRARFDFIWEKPILIESINHIRNNDIGIINDSYVCEKAMRITNDRFFLGNSITMNKFCNIFNLIKDFNRKNVPIQGSDLMQYYLLNHFKYRLIGNKFYYYKFNNYFNSIKLKKKKVYIKISNSLQEAISKEFLLNGYHVYSYIDNSKLLKRLSSYFNYIQLEKDIIPENLDYYLSSKRNILNVTSLIDNQDNKENKNTTNLVLNCKIISENNNLVSIQSNECYINDLSYFIYQYVITNQKNSIIINGSYNYYISTGDIVIYDTWEKENKIKRNIYYRVSNIKNNFINLEIYRQQYSEYEQKILKKIEIMKQCSKKFFKLKNVMSLYKNTQIPSLLIVSLNS